MVSKKNKRVAITLSGDVYKVFKEVARSCAVSLSKVIDYSLKEYALSRLDVSEFKSLVNK